MPSQEVSAGDFSLAFASHTGKIVDKWSLYLPIYDRIFANYRSVPLSILEIGVQNGGSLELWSEYFTSIEKIVGCDIDENCRSLTFSRPEICLVIGDINSEQTIAEIKSICSEYEIIIDDGSHMSRDVITTFIKLFPLLKNDGVYVIEDLHTSYWKSYGGGLANRRSSVEFFKFLIDILNFEHWEDESELGGYLKGMGIDFSVDFNRQLLSQIHQISFLNSLCVIEKKSADQNVLGVRKIAGNVPPVTANAIASEGQPLNIAHFQKNPTLIYKVRASISRMLGRS